MSSVLAKILMVTKLTSFKISLNFCSVLAKILMVTKPCHVMIDTGHEFCSSKNPYGNKTSLYY